MSHPIYELPLDSGALILMPSPGAKGCSTAEALEQLREQGVTAVVTAQTQQEMEDKGVAGIPAECEKLKLAWFHLAIEDDEGPTDTFEALWPAASQSLQAALQNGHKVAIHCMGGSGRTGLIAGLLLADLGWKAEDIVQQVQALRPGAFTKAPQVSFLQQYMSVELAAI